MFNPKSIIMKTLSPSSKNHVLKILCSLLLLLVMLPGVLAQEAASDERSDILDKEGMNKINTVHDKSTPIMLNVVGGGARIHGLTVGRGGGNNVYNSAFGDLALSSNTTGDRNTAIGSYALRFNSTGRYNTAIGRWTLHYNSSGSYNIALGVVALENNQTGNHNIAIGYETCAGNSSGYSNIGIGSRALYHNTVNSNLVAVGDSALYHNGSGATSLNHAVQNTALGSKALFANTTGSWNTAAGYQALYSNNTGSDNTAFGQYSLQNNTTGRGNTAVGVWGIRAVTTGSDNTAIGAYAGLGGNYNQATFIGRSVNPTTSNLTNITGIGYDSRPTASNQVRIGNTSVTSIGGNAGWTNFSDGGFKSDVSDDVAGLEFILRLRPVSYNLDVHRLAAELGEDLIHDEEGNKSMETPDEFTLKSRDEKSAIRFTGFIAQEVETTVNELGVAFSGVDAPANKSSYYGLRYADFVVPLVRAVQEQQAQIEALSPEGIDALREELSELRQANEQLLVAEASLRAESETLSQRQSLLETENENIRGQVKDILSMLETLGVEMQDCCQQQTTGRNPGTSSLNQMPDNARLEQNTPNPFNANTLIRYFLPEGTHRAQIIITDMAGTQVMELPLEHQGAGQVLIHGGTLPSGTYVYTLTVDGRKVDSKRMVLL
jgi:hypothetical protein